MGVSVVLGNEAADVDSIVCAILYAFLLHITGNGHDRHLAPVVNVPRADLALRADAKWLLKSVGLDTTSLMFLDDIDLRRLKKVGALKSLVLVDHNRLGRQQEEEEEAGLEELIVEIVDHHKDERQYPKDVKRNIQMVGSCSTLVAAEYTKKAPAALQNTQIASMLLAGVLLDTGNMDPALGKATAADDLMAKVLSPKCEETPAEFYERLKNLRLDVSTLTTRDLLRKDYKQWTMGGGGFRVGISSVPVFIEKMSTKDNDMAQAIDNWQAECELDLLLIMNADTDPSDGTFKRQLVLLPSSSTTDHTTLIPRLLDHFKKSGIALETLDGVKHLPRRAAVFLQLDAKISRKQIQPTVAAFYDDVRLVCRGREDEAHASGKWSCPQRGGGS
mmetsp:Transcript_25585/g.31042  ORF Transcript_25585/g.31042 Transcript_25585/m.31042 type:complete len:389 (-) Transcript_25585:490-1656(-)